MTADTARAGARTIASGGGFPAGFRTMTAETDAELPVEGRLPGWLSGTLLRNGPALFDAGGKSLRHWFDGQAMLHAFRFAPDPGGEVRVSYRNRLLDTPSRRSLAERGRISYAEFATDPCASLFGRFFTRFTKKATPNACVNVVPTTGGRWQAVSETSLAVEFDPATLRTLGVVQRDGMGGRLATAHPHVVPGSDAVVDYSLHYSRVSEYRFYVRSAAGVERPLASVPAERPGYVHSFAVTDRHLVLAIFPFVVQPLDLLLRGRPFVENFRWRPELGTRLVVVDLADGSRCAELELEPFFAFHHVNAYRDGVELVLDVSAYDDAGVVRALYLDRLRAGRPAPVGRLRRYRVNLSNGRWVRDDTSDANLELPRIAYRSHNGRRYRHAYGAGSRAGDGSDFLDQLTKVDVQTGATRHWAQDGCYPGEPVFVPAPGARREDDGVVLSVVLDPARDRSFLLALDAGTFTEIARADAPHAVPFGFHGQYSPTDATTEGA